MWCSSLGLAEELPPMDDPDDDDGCGIRGPKRSNDTHRSTIDPDAWFSQSEFGAVSQS